MRDITTQLVTVQYIRAIKYMHLGSHCTDSYAAGISYRKNVWIDSVAEMVRTKIERDEVTRSKLDLYICALRLGFAHILRLMLLSQCSLGAKRTRARLGGVVWMAVESLPHWKLRSLICAPARIFEGWRVCAPRKTIKIRRRDTRARAEMTPSFT